MKQNRTSRREVLFTMSAAGCFLPALANAASGRLIPQKPSARVIVDNDFAGDPDGLAALIHQMLTPKTRVTLVTASALNPLLVGDGASAGKTAAAGADLARELIERARFSSPPPVMGGAEDFALDPSPAAEAIVNEAMRDDALPLYLTCGGPLTNVAAALRLEPAIADRMTLVWIGGGAYPEGAPEYNLETDIPAARAVIENSHLPIWQIPKQAYRQAQYSIAELTADMRPISSFTKWLYDRFTAPPEFVELGGAWPLGDSPLVLLTAISDESSRYADITARRIEPDLSYGDEIAGRFIRVYEDLDVRLMFGDFLALLRLHAARSPLVNH